MFLLKNFARQGIFQLSVLEIYAKEDIPDDSRKSWTFSP